MNKKSIFQTTNYPTFLLFLFLIIGFSAPISAFQSNHTEYKGIVVDNETNRPIVSATISLSNSNISTVTNDEGEFLLKVPADQNNGELTISHLGYNNEVIKLSNFTSELKIRLNLSVTELSEVNIDPKNPEALIRAVMKKKGDNYLDHSAIMTAFYRETIKKRRTYVSLSEAVVDVYKNPYSSKKTDIVKLYRARKSADYKKLDTLTLKLQGGPTTTLYIDVMKNPENVFTQEMLNFYQFAFDKSTKINNRYLCFEL